MEYEFRVWSKKHNKMIYFNLQELLINYNDEWDYCAIAGTDLFRIHQDIDIDDVAQSTGVQDRNGKDIYRDDILLIENATTGIVIEGRGGYLVEFADGHHLSFDATASENIEIVGNTWENKNSVEVNNV